MKLGLISGYSGSKMSIPIEAIKQAEALGYESVWTAEAYGSDAVTPAAWILALTDTIKVGTAIMQMPARSPAMAAMTAMSLAELSGGRFICERGGHGNVAQILKPLVAGLDRRGLDGRAAVPWFFPAPDAYRGKLEARGFTVDSIELIDRPTPLPGEFPDWLATFAEAFTARLPEAERPAYVAEVTEALRPELCDSEGHWTVNYVRLRFSARKPG